MVLCTCFVVALVSHDVLLGVVCLCRWFRLDEYFWSISTAVFIGEVILETIYKTPLEELLTPSQLLAFESFPAIAVVYTFFHVFKQLLLNSEVSWMLVCRVVASACAVGSGIIGGVL